MFDDSKRLPFRQRFFRRFNSVDARVDFGRGGRGENGRRDASRTRRRFRDVPDDVSKFTRKCREK